MRQLRFYDMTIRESLGHKWPVIVWNIARKTIGLKYSHVSIVAKKACISPSFLFLNGQEYWLNPIDQTVYSQSALDDDDTVSVDIELQTWIPPLHKWYTCASWVYFSLTGEYKRFITPDDIYQWATSLNTDHAPTVGAKTT